MQAVTEQCILRLAAADGQGPLARLQDECHYMGTQLPRPTPNISRTASVMVLQCVHVPMLLAQHSKEAMHAVGASIAAGPSSSHIWATAWAAKVQPLDEEKRARRPGLWQETVRWPLPKKRIEVEADQCWTVASAASA